MYKTKGCRSYPFFYAEIFDLAALGHGALAVELFQLPE